MNGPREVVGTPPHEVVSSGPPIEYDPSNPLCKHCPKPIHEWHGTWVHPDGHPWSGEPKSHYATPREEDG